MRKFLLLGFALQCSLLALAFYPIPPQPLRLLVAKSQLIIRGKVLKTGLDQQREKNHDFAADYALINVTEIWQGVLKEKQVKVYFCKGMICPLPGVFYDGEEVLAFLDKESNGSDYEVHALSYGVKHDLTAEGFSLYRSRINEIQTILKMNEGQEKKDQLREWLVACAEEELTRWDGLYELTYGYERIGFYWPDLSLNKIDCIPDSNQQKRLFSAFMRTKNLDRKDLNLVELIKGVDDCKVMGRLKTAFMDIDTSYEYYLYQAETFMEKIVFLSDHHPLRKIYTEYISIGYLDPITQSRYGELFRAFKKELEGISCEELKEDCGGLMVYKKWKHVM